MKKTIKLLMLSAICALLLTGCRKKDDAEPKTDGAFAPVYGYGSHGEHRGARKLGEF